jgi:glutathione S-transferase
VATEASARTTASGADAPRRYRLIGSTASPYALKMRAILRYRRVPFDWVIMTRELRRETAYVQPNLIPILQYPDTGEYRTDTTALAYDLETRHPSERSILPPHPAVRFLCDLLEDMADELAVKCLFLYRWWDPEDQEYVSRWTAQEWSTSEAPVGTQEEIDEFRARQVGRMRILGATGDNKAVLERVYFRILEAFEPHVGMNRYLFGARPSLADFAWYGQLSEMATDPSPMRIMRECAPFTDIWARRLDDASGVEGDWHKPEASVTPWVEALLRLAGEFYLPFLKANAEAYAEGRERLQLDALGGTYVLQPFKFQVRCLECLCRLFAELSAQDLDLIRPVLSQTGCLPYLDE